MNTELANYTDITVMLDGVFFDDGSFIGDDSTGYFAAVKTEIDARHDLLREIQSKAQQGKSSDDIFRDAQEAVTAPDIDLSPKSTPAERYAYYKKLYAREHLGLRKHLGDEKALERIRTLLNRPWPRLRKN